MGGLPNVSQPPNVRVVKTTDARLTSRQALLQFRDVRISSLCVLFVSVSLYDDVTCFSIFCVGGNERVSLSGALGGYGICGGPLAGHTARTTVIADGPGAEHK